MRRSALIAAVTAAAVAAGVTVFLAKRTVRWNDARTMPPPLEAAVRAYAKGDSASGVRAVRLLAARYRAPAWESRARVLAGTHLVRDRRDGEILELLPKELPPSDPLAAHALALRARGFLARRELAHAADAASRAAAVPGFPGVDDARLTQSAALEADGKWREAIAALDKTPGAAEAVAAARILKAHGDANGARRRLVDTLAAAGGDGDVDRLRDAFAEVAPGMQPSAEERTRLAERARAFLDDGKAQTAIDVLHVARTDPASATGTEALIEAEALLKLGQVAGMAPLIARARQAGPSFADGARYFEARRAAANGSFGAFRAGLEGLARRGDAEWRERALLDLARMVEGAPNASTVLAYRRYRLAAGAHADPLALLREAWASFDLGRHAEAAAGFARALSRADAPDGVRVTATYWNARIADLSGRRADAKNGYTRVADEFPNHYYGTLAATRLSRPAPVAPTAAPAVVDPATLGSSGRWLAAARALASVGLWDEAAPCYRAATAGNGKLSAEVAFEAASAARAAAAISDAIGLAQSAIGDRDRVAASSIPRDLWRLLYPAPSADAITREARGAGLDPNLVAAVALQESAFNPLAVSSAGARGLLQVMPSVGAELARAAGMKKFDSADLFDPAVNLKLGCAHLAEYRRRFGSVPRALAAYNGGPSRVERWSSASGKDDDERFVERIPIPETRLYVKRVMTGSRLYAVAWPHGLGAD
jgi:soluble lytic murein transglycosylase-like protein